MSTIADFNRIEDCDKIDARCIDAYVEASLNEDDPKILEVNTSWGDNEVDLSPAVKAAETLTSLSLSPSTNPNCLVYEPERGDNICIHGDDLSRIISMRYLRDVTQSVRPSDGIVYQYNGTTNLFEPYDLKSFVAQVTAAISNLQQRMTAVESAVSSLRTRVSSLETRMTAVEGRVTTLEGKVTTLEGKVTTLEGKVATLESEVATLKSKVATLETTVANHESRLQTIEALLVKPTGAPSGAKIAWGTINLYSDHSAAIDSNGNVTSLDKTHGLYTHSLNTNAAEDEILG